MIFLIIASITEAQVSDSCYPPCRDGFICHNGECVSECNPPCPKGEQCNNGECEKIHDTLVQIIRTDIPCKSVFIVKPDLGPQIVPGKFNEIELRSVSAMLTNAVQSNIDSDNEVISAGEVSTVMNCNAKKIVVKVESYHKEPAVIGQFVGVITISIELYDSMQQNTLYSIQKFKAEGGRHWGDTVPLENAVKSVSKSIRRHLKVKM